MGSRLALAILSLGVVELFDFDNATGVITNPLTFPNNVQGIEDWVYGIEFSPDGTKLYKSHPDGQRLYQYNLMAGSSTDIINSAVLVGTSTTTNRIGALQLGPDGKIYVAKFNSFFLGAINNPNALGIACNYIDNAVSLNGRRSRLGLPTFIQSHFNPQFTYIDPCVGDSTFFFITSTNSLDSVHWNFGDSSSGISNTSTDFNPYHLFNAPGIYNVQLTKYTSACTSVFSRTVIITVPSPPVDLGNDTILCSGVSLVLNAGTPNSTYLWQDSSTNSSFTVSFPGIYWVERSNVCSSDKDSIVIDYYPSVNLNLGADTILCREEILVLDAAMPDGAYLWQDGSTDSTLTVNSVGLYWVEVTDTNNCSKKDSITISYSVLPNVDLGNDTLLCEGESLLLGITNTGISYYWQDGSTDVFYIVNSPGLFWVEVINTDGCPGSDTVLINYSMSPELELGEDTVLCPGQVLVLNASSPGASYLWQDASTDSVFTVSSPGLYWVKIANVFGCSSSDSMRLETQYLKADFGYELIPCTNEIQFFNLSSDTLSSHWNFGDGTTSNENNPLHAYSENEKYNVILITNPYSPCADTTEKVILFENDAFTDTLFVPNVFTPNGDGKNDYFEIMGVDNPCINVNKLMIFNRWGLKVFEADENQLRWDGTANGKKLTEGVYFYILEGKELEKSGSVTLLK